MASFFVCKFMDLNTVSAQKYAKENDLSQYPAILTARLFDNPYIIYLSSTNTTSHKVLYVRMMNTADSFTRFFACFALLFVCHVLLKNLEEDYP